MTVRNGIFGIVGILWGTVTVLYGWGHGLNYDGSYDVGRVIGYLFGWVLIGAGAAALRSKPRTVNDLW